VNSADTFFKDCSDLVSAECFAILVVNTDGLINSLVNILHFCLHLCVFTRLLATQGPVVLVQAKITPGNLDRLVHQSPLILMPIVYNLLILGPVVSPVRIKPLKP